MTTTPAHRFVIDTDMGVDDAAAIAWLLTQREHVVELLGVSAVWGNTTVVNATGNVHSLLAALGRIDIPVVMGQAGPLRGKRVSVGAIIHGQDGLWGAGSKFTRDHSNTNLVEWYRSLGHRADGATLLTLGPLTNLAQLLKADPDVLRVFSRVVILGGARYGGGITPTAETNIWHDPDAAHRVLSASLPITLVTRDAHTMFSLTPRDIEKIVTSSTPAALFLAKPLSTYAAVQAKYASAISCADVVAAVYAVDPSVATTTRRGLVKVVASDEPLVRGQTVMGFSMHEKIPMIESPTNLEPLIQRHFADPSFNFDAALGAILAREPDNAEVVLSVDGARIKSTFLRAIAEFPEE